MNKFLLFLSLLITNTIAAQSIVISGSIKDETSKLSLIGVTVTVDNNTVLSDANGKYSFTSSAGYHTIRIAYVGYKEINDSFSVATSVTKNYLLVTNLNQLDLIVVSASKYAKKISEETVSMNVLKPSLIQNTNSIAMDEAINRVPGVNIVDGQANIRGGSGYSYGAGSRVLVLVDDIPQLTADAGDVKWEFLPVENLEQVEIIKGASSTLYGSSALNGVINIRTAYPTAKPQTQVNFYQGIYQNPKRKETIWWGNKQPYFSGGYFTHSQKLGQLDLVVGGNIFNEQSYLQGVFTQRGRINANTRYRFKKVEGLSVGVNVNYLYNQSNTFFLWENADSGIYKPYGGLDSATTSLTTNKYYRYNIDPFITYYKSNGVRHSLKTRLFVTNNATLENQDSRGEVYYGEYQFQQPFKFGLRLTTGAVLISTKIRSQLYGDHNGNNQALYIQFDQKIKKLSLIGGVRYEFYQLDTVTANSKPVFRAGANYEIIKGTNVRASFGQGFRFPSVAEKFVKTNVGSLFVYPNPELQPERGWSAEFGVQQGFKISSWLGYVDVAVFTQHLTNFMEFTFGQFGAPTPPLFGLGFRSENLDEARINGIEATTFGQGKILGSTVNLLGGITLIQPYDLRSLERSDSLIAANPDYESNVKDSIYNLRYLKYRYTTTFKIDADIKYKKFSGGTGIRYNSMMINIDQLFNGLIPGLYEYRKQDTNGDLVVDTRIGYNVNDNMKIGFIVKNLLNNQYTERPAQLEGPRNFTMQIMVKF